MEKNMSTAQIVRLTTGEELLCNIKGQTENHITIIDPYVILPTADGNLQFMKYMGYAVYNELPIKIENVMWVVNPNKELLSKHSEMTGSIAVPTKPSIIT
jgi:hypothetical protein